MKMFVIAALIAVAAAGRLEHLERSYLPPGNDAAGSNFGSQGSSAAHGAFGSHSQSSNSGSFGGHSGSFGGQSGHFGAARARQPSVNAGAFSSATSNQYLPPNRSSNGASQGLPQNFGAQPSRYQAASQQYSAPSTQYGSPAGSSSFSQSGFQSQSQSGAANRQYLAPRVDSTNNMPQQAFDEQTGYHY